MKANIVTCASLFILGLASGVVAAEPRPEPLQADAPEDAVVAPSAACAYSMASEVPSRLSIPVRGPDGNALVLDFRPGNGWRLSDAQGDGATALKVGTDTPEALEPERASSVEQPLSVTVDGPTGFVFAWMHETASWRFIGHVSVPAAVAGVDITAGE